jgi:4-diphosphocytidyl-2-C-methyl-D-erythritol kinase
MNFRRDELKRTARAPAKLNLVLDLLGRRDDGFHEVETLMVPVRLADSLSFVPLRPDECRVPGELQLEVVATAPLSSRQNQTPVPVGKDNLVVRALNLLQERSGCEHGARVELVKRIPIAAGLGGGSSNAAAALRLANCGWGIGWSDGRLSQLAAEIGSDVPFFISNGAAVCRGRGERVEHLAALSPIDVVIIKPPVEFSTTDVYRAYDSLPNVSAANTSRVSQWLPAFASSRCCEIGRRMRNALQAAASLLSPWVEKLRQAFNELDFVGHQLSGSGSAYFGVCRHPQHARRLANILQTKQLGFVYATRSCY